MTTKLFQPVINLLQDIADYPERELDTEKLEQAISNLEGIKSGLINPSEDLVDLIDEVQDYLEYLLNTEEPLMGSEFQEEIADVIKDLKEIEI